MKKILISLSLATLTLCAVACKKTQDVAPSYVGDYTLSSLVTYKVGTQVVTENAKGTLSIKQGSTANTLLFTEKLPAYESIYMATVSGNDFKVEPITDKIVVDGKAYTAPQTAYGTFSVNGVKISKTTATAETGQTSNRVLQKSVELTAFK